MQCRCVTIPSSGHEAQTWHKATSDHNAWVARALSSDRDQYPSSLAHPPSLVSHSFPVLAMEPIASTSADVIEYRRPHAEVASRATPLNEPPSVVQVLGETINFVEGNQQNHYHQHIHAPLQPTNQDIPAILEHVPNYRDIHIANLGRATEGTGPCFDEWEEFCGWTNVQGALKTMWGTGMPGAGKTIFASIVINEVEARAKASEHPICVGYIYFRYSDHTTATVRDFLLVLSLRGISGRKTLPSESELVQLLHRFTEVIAEMFYFLDALDEAPPDVQFDLLEKLSTLNIKIFITSRPLAHLNSCFPGAHRFSIRAQDCDLDLHISKEIARSPVLRAILNEAGPELRYKITSTVKKKCEGMFLHASLQLEALRGCANIYAVEKTLENFPCQIEDVYQQTWKRIEAQAPEMAVIAKNALIWVLCAMRSLKIEELRYAVATCPDTYKFDRRRLVDNATLMGLCRGLVNIEEETNIVRFVHYTAKDVVKGLISESSPYPYSLPAAVCMALLAEHGFQQKNLTDKRALNASLKAKPLLAYAYKNWSTHAHESLDDTYLATRLSQFIQGCGAFPVGLSAIYLSSIDEILEPLHMAAYFDFPLSVAGSEHLCNPNHPTPHMGRTPLMLATRRNSLSAMRELLSLPGILVNAADKEGDIPLVYAAEWGAKASLSLLLAHPKINVNVTNSYGRTALMAASSEEPATLLLAHPKIKPNQVDSGRKTALMRASRIGCLEVVRVLLDDPRVQYSLRSRDGRTALDIAEERPFGDHIDYDEVIELLRTHSDRERLRSRNPLKDMLRRTLPNAWKK
ncbi:hypothetical protein BKA70DRAFT_1480127 [Coprinopsis sp. MPI-PUGE-AT-0042]|nr:hypothetical protein BKA70DRAFT_1480127 [Coprinopsis sp. MPI-PUGE-AT-0042]